MNELELCGVDKTVDEKIYESAFRWFGHIERMEYDKIAKRVHMGECLGSHLVGRLWNRLTDSVNE